MDRTPAHQGRPSGLPFFVYLLVFLGLLWGTALVALWTERESLLQDAEDEVVRKTQLVVAQTVSLVGELRSGFVLLDHWLAAHPQADPRTDRDFLLLVASVESGFQTPVDLCVVSARGDLYAPLGLRPLVPTTSVVDRDYFRVQTSPETWGLYVARPVKGRVSSRWNVPFSYPVTRRNAGMVALMVSVDVLSLVEFYESARPKPEGTVTVVRQDGILLGRIPFRDDEMGMDLSGSPWWNRHASGIERALDPTTGASWVTSFQDLAGVPLTLVVSQSFDSVLGGWKRQVVYTGVALVVVSAAMVFWGALLRQNWRRLSLSEAEKRLLAAELSQSQELSDAIAENSNDVVTLQRLPDLRMEHMNSAMTRLRGWTPEDFRNRPIRDVMGAQAYDSMADQVGGMVKRFEAGDPAARFGKVELDLPHKDGTLTTFELMVTLLLDPQGKPDRVLAIFRDLTDRLARERAVRQLAFYDQLTGVPNRRLFEDRLNQALARAQRDRVRGALVFVDLDRFKPVNDRLGHAAGDDLLQQVARRMEALVRSSDTVARMGGDEFVVLITDVADTAQAAAVAEKLRAALNEPFRLGEVEVSLSASFGLVPFPDHGTRPEDLVRLSDAAMYQAKGRGRNQVVVLGEPAPGTGAT